MHPTSANAELDEHTLVDAWRAGDAEAMGLLYERYAPALRAYCAHRLGGRADAEDAVHDTFLRAQVGMAGFEPGARVWPWLATIAAHVCTDTLRRRLRTLETEVVPIVAVDVEEHVAARMRAAIVGDALQSLPPRYRVPLYLRHFGGSTYDEIARLQGRSVASVRSMLMRGRRHLSHQVEAVARSERQWPLPGAAPVLGRLRQRLRSFHIGRDRMSHPAQQLLALQAGWLASAVAGIHGAAAVVGVVATVWAALPDAVTTDIGHSRPAPLEATLVAHVWLPDVGDAASPGDQPPHVNVRSRLAGVGTEDAPTPGRHLVAVNTGYSLEKDDYSLYSHHTLTVTGPVGPPLDFSGGTNWNCFNQEADNPQRRACEFVVDTNESLPSR